MRLAQSRFSSWLTNNCYLFFAVLAFLTFYYEFPDIIRPVLLLFITILNFGFVKSGRANLLIFLYFIAAFLSLTGSLIRPYPFSFFLTDMYWAYLPIIFFFIGCQSIDDYPIFYKRSLWAFMFIFIVGFYFLVFPTERYISKTLEILNLHSHYTEETYMFARFASFLDSYHTSNLGVCSLCFSFGLLKLGNKNNVFIKLFAIVAIAISFITIMLAQQRVAMYTSIVISMYFLIVNSSKNKFGGIITIIILGAILLFAIDYYLSFFGDDFLSQITNRFSHEKSSGVVSERSSQWDDAFSGFLMEPLFGLGIGSGGHLAVEAGLKPAVADGSYFKILLEGGLVSFIPFSIVLFSSLLKSFKHRKKYYIEFPLLFFFTCSLIGANIIDMPYISMFMWYILGRINRNDKKQIISQNIYGR